tara:strand:+ start:273 stop:680 length:408 start_codon:yes stop_codon:yes gene_type:complete
MDIPHGPFKNNIKLVFDFKKCSLDYLIEIYSILKVSSTQSYEDIISLSNEVTTRYELGNIKFTNTLFHFLNSLLKIFKKYKKLKPSSRNQRERITSILKKNKLPTIESTKGYSPKEGDIPLPEKKILKKLPLLKF